MSEQLSERERRELHPFGDNDYYHEDIGRMYVATIENILDDDEDSNN